MRKALNKIIYKIKLNKRIDIFNVASKNQTNIINN